jgi:hypothetical protein
LVHEDQKAHLKTRTLNPKSNIYAMFLAIWLKLLGLENSKLYMGVILRY